jgi:hypothetical protein
MNFKTILTTSMKIRTILKKLQQHVGFSNWDKSKFKTPTAYAAVSFPNPALPFYPFAHNCWHLMSIFTKGNDLWHLQFKL